jgi:hypothetical protein
MAARNRPGLSENTRQRIKTTMLAERLMKHVAGEVEMSSTQIRAAEILLRKTLPDLSAVHTEDGKEQTIHDWLAGLADPEGAGPTG